MIKTRLVVPQTATHQQQKHLKSNHQLLKKHVPLGCLTQSQPVKKLTASVN